MTGVRVNDVADWVTIDGLARDPHRVYRRLRDEQPVAWVPELNRYGVSRFDDVRTIEHDSDTYTASEEGSLATRAVGGRALSRSSDPEHAIERKMADRPFRPKVVNTTWMPVFSDFADELIAGLRGRGSADLIADFAAPLSARCLRTVLGLEGVSDDDMYEFSELVIAGLGNYGNDEAVWAANAASMAKVDAVMDEIIPAVRRTPNASMISAFVNADEPPPEDIIRANIKIAIGGGMNEPRDALGLALWALFRFPEQRRLVEDDEKNIDALFEETIRWDSVVAMYPRQTTRETVLGGIVLPARARIGVLIGSANRDERQFDRPDVFDLTRDRKPHVAFGGGMHYCLGAWVAKAIVSRVGLPKLLAALPGLRPVGDLPPIEGWIFRGVPSLPAEWDH